MNIQPGDGSKRRKVTLMAEHKTIRQLKARQIETVYHSMDGDYVGAIDSRMRRIALDLKMAAEAAVNAAVGDLDKLIADGYAADEVEAVFRHHPREPIPKDRNWDVLCMWIDSGAFTVFTVWMDRKSRGENA